VTDADDPLPPHAPSPPRPTFARRQGGPKPPAPPRPPRRPLGRFWASLGAVSVVVLLVAAGFAAFGLKLLMEATPQIPDRGALLVVNQAPGMTFEDRTGRIIATRGPKHGSPVTLRDLPADVPEAFLAAEDRRFYHHGAVDMRGIARALWVNWRAGRTVQGGSTLTQQLAKTLFLTPDQTLRRKLQEAVIAMRIEQTMSKDEVLELYLNRIFFGDNAYGIEAAAETYFDKPARSLTLQEAALLAALPKAPTRLALTNDMAAALARSRLVLANMRAEGWITPAQEQAALAAPPKLAAEHPGEGQYGYVLDMAAAQAVQIVGGKAPDLVVRLSIDPTLQDAAQHAVRDSLAGDGKRVGASQGALVLLAPDGAIRALVGGVDHQLSAFNRATQAQRQPGSSFKPFVYAAAMESGVQPSDIRQDAPVRFGTWTPTNYEGGYRGAVTVADALAFSINTVAARLAGEVGGAHIGELAHRFGLKSIPDKPDLSVALGAYEVNLLDLTGAYQVFQQAGRRSPPYLIEQITTLRGDNVYQHDGGVGVTVYDIAYAGEMVRMLEGVLLKGTGVRAGLGRPAAGKTGTTQNFRDAWFIGFTPDWVCGVWIGNDDERPMYHVTGGQLPAMIWRRMMLAAHQGLAPRDFDWVPSMPLTPPASLGVDEAAEWPNGAGAADAPIAGMGQDAETGADAPPDEDQRARFYQGLSDSFGRAADQGGYPPRDSWLRDPGQRDPGQRDTGPRERYPDEPPPDAGREPDQ
jgi:penicillin-binding protein 1A